MKRIIAWAAAVILYVADDDVPGLSWSPARVLTDAWAMEHERARQEHRVTWWIKQFALLDKLNPAWAQRCRQELADSLIDVPDGGIPPLPGPV